MAAWEPAPAAGGIEFGIDGAGLQGHDVPRTVSEAGMRGEDESKILGAELAQ